MPPANVTTHEPQEEFDFNLADERTSNSIPPTKGLPFELLSFAFLHPLTAIRSLPVLNLAFKLEENGFRDIFGNPTP